MEVSSIKTQRKAQEYAIEQGNRGYVSAMIGNKEQLSFSVKDVELVK